MIMRNNLNIKKGFTQSLDFGFVFGIARTSVKKFGKKIDQKLMSVFSQPKTKIPKPKFSTGFTLLELLLALGIFALGSVVVGYLLIDSTNASRAGQERSRAALYLQESIDAIRFIGHTSSSTVTNGDHGIINTGSGWAFSGVSDAIDGKYTRIVSVSSTTPEIANLKRANISISWTFSSSRNMSVSAETYVFTQ